MDDMPEPDWQAKRHGEAERLRRVYGARDAVDSGNRYSMTSRATLMAVQERERLLLGYVSRRSWEPADLECLDVGCGTGGELTRLLAYGATPGRLHGIDLREDAILSARSRLPLCDLRIGDASELPFATGSMDLVTQLTVLSSILDEEVRRRVAAEMVRVCCPGGLIVSYDFTMNPTNADTRGLGNDELRGLFPGCRIEPHRVTLAPPLARRVAPRSRWLAAILGSLPPLRTHLMAFITPPSAPVDTLR